MCFFTEDLGPSASSRCLKQPEPVADPVSAALFNMPAGWPWMGYFDFLRSSSTAVFNPGDNKRLNCCCLPGSQTLAEHL